MKLNKETKVGILVLIAGIILYIGFNFLKGNDFLSPSSKYYIMYDNVEGLTVSNPVIINGYTIGRVEEITIIHEKRDSLLVKIDVKKGVLLNKGTKAKLASPDLLGGKVIEIVQGKQEGLLSSGETLLGLKEKGLAATLEEKATPVLNTLDTAISNLTSYFDDDISKSIRNTVKNLEKTSYYAALASKQANSVVEKNSANLNEIAANVKDLSVKLNTLAESTNSLIGDKLSSFVDSLNNLEINKIIHSASNAANQLEQMMTNIDSSGGTIGKMIYDPSFYNNLNTTINDLDFLLVDFQANPQRYINVSVFGGKVKEVSPIRKVKPSSFKEEVKIEFSSNYIPNDLSAEFYHMESKQKHTPISQVIDKDEIILQLDNAIPSGSYIIKLAWNKGKNQELVELEKR